MSEGGQCPGAPRVQEAPKHNELIGFRAPYCSLTMGPRGSSIPVNVVTKLFKDNHIKVVVRLGKLPEMILLENMRAIIKARLRRKECTTKTKGH